MQSIRIWLAGAIRNDIAHMRRGMATWLQADATLAQFRVLGATQTRNVCRMVLWELQAWLTDNDTERLGRARTALGGLRGCLLARSYLIEYLKQEGHLGTRSREEARTVVGLLDVFFTDDSAPARGLAPALPPTEHVDRAGAGTKLPEP